MANSYITSTSRFKPYTFAEMLQPVQIYTDASNAVETELSNLDILANDIVGKLNPNDPEDAKTLKVYEAFKTKMDDALETFYREGLTPDSKKALASLKSQYSKDINPINVAYERRVKDLDFIRQQKAVNPYLIIEGIGSSTSAYMNGNSPDPVVVDLYKASEAAKNASIGLSKQFIEQIGLQNVDGYIGQYLMHGIQKGIDSTMVADFTAYVDAIKNGQNKELQTPQGLALSNMFEQIRTANNYDNLSEDAQDRLDASIVQGLVSGAAAEVDINYTPNNYWQIQNEKMKYEINAAKLRASRTPPGDTVNADLRTSTGLYQGENYDMSVLANTLATEFAPEDYINHNGTLITNGLQAYNIIHQADAKIAELQARYDSLYESRKKQLKGTVSLDPATGDPISLEQRILSDPTIKSVYDELETLKAQKRGLERDLGSISISDDEIDRMRSYTSERVDFTMSVIEDAFADDKVVIKDKSGKVISLNSATDDSVVYVDGKQDSILTEDIRFYNKLKAYKNSSRIGQVSPQELEIYATMMGSDISTGVEAEKTVLIFNKTNSSKGLEDLVNTLSGNIMPLIASGKTANITDANGKKIKKKVLRSIIDSTTGGIDVAKIDKAELDFTSARRRAVKITTTDGHVLYIDASYLGDQANAFISGKTGIGGVYEDTMRDYRTSKVSKATTLNTSLKSAAESIQNAFDLNRNPAQSLTLSSSELKALLSMLNTDDLL